MAANAGRYETTATESWEEDAISIPGKQSEPRVNERIRIPQVRVIAEDGSQAGIMATRDALAMAQAKGLDLVEVAPTSRPPVCKIMDYGKFKYEQNRRDRVARKNQHQQQLKEVKMRPKIDEHDYSFKMRHAREFLEERDKVKFTLTFRGREMAHPELGHEVIQRVITELQDIANVEQHPRSEGRTLTMVMTPKARTTPAPGKGAEADGAAPHAKE